MHKFVVTLMASLLSCSAAFAFWPEATESSLEVGVGYRQDRLEWKTSSHFDSGYSTYNNSYSDNYNYQAGLPLKLRSELKWRDLQIWQIEASGKYVTCDNIYLRACGDYGWITHGKNTDSDYITLGKKENAYYYSGYDDSYYYYDYDNSNSEFEFAHSKSKARGHVYDAEIAVGYQFRLCDDSLAVAPLVGYSWHGQHIEDRHLRQNFYLDDESFVFGEGTRSKSYYSSYPSASFSEYGTYYDSYPSYSYGGRHSKYHARWNGPFIGFDFDYRFGCGCESDWEIFGGYEFHWAMYHAKARWDLRTDLFNGFHHRAKDAYGHVFDIGVKWDFCECWTLALKGEFMWWWAHHGRDRAKIAQADFGNVKTDCFLSVPLRDIKWHSAAVSVDIGMVF
jgi:hypothetical protein